jgi:dolichyl-phosphate beta-glucosyltransferase
VHRKDPLIASHPRRSLVIPMFDEATRIGRTLDILEASDLLDDRLELLLVDDGSTDGTAELVEQRIRGLARARVVRLDRNRGKGAAVRAGVLAAEGATRVFVDADLCVPADDIERCFATLESGEADVVYGTRAHAHSALADSQPGYRVVTGRVFNLLLRLLGLTEELDTQCGLKGITSAAVPVVIEPLVTERFAFDVEVLARATRAGLHLEGLPVQWSHVPASRVRPVQDGMEMARQAVRIRRALDRESRDITPPATAAGVMAADAIDAMARVERVHWWFRGKHRLVLDELRRGRTAGLVLDVGAGTGGLLDRLSSAGYRSAGFELDPAALAHARAAQPRLPLARSVAEALPIRDGRAAAVTMLDVLEHLDDDVAGLRELARVVRPGGLVLVAVPAYQWAWSEHDVRLGHRRRYARRRLREVAEAAGLHVERCTHFNSWLVPIAFLVRRTPLRRFQGDGPAEEASMGNAWVNRLLQRVTDAERTVLASADLPVGLSILLVARVPS